MPQNIESTNLQNILVQSLHDMFLPIFVKNHPFLDRMRKVTAGGSGYRIPIMTGPGGGAGGDFVTSLANANSDGSTNQGFVPVPAQVYGHELINWESQPYTDTPQSPVNVAVLATKNAMNAATDNLASMLLGGGFGVLGKILSATNTSGTLWTIVFTVPSDAIKFNEQNVIVQKVTPTTSGLTTGTGFVTGVNQIQGSIEIDTQGSGFTPAATNVVGLQGQLLADTTPTGFQGTQAWVPPVASRTNGIVGDTFLGVPRTLASNAVFTSGWAWNGAGLPLFNAIQAAAGYMSNYKDAKPDTLYCNPLALPKLSIECDQKIRYDMKSVSGVETGFAGFEIVTPAGKVDVLAEPAQPSNQLLLTKASSWVFASPKGKIMGPATNGKILIDSYGTANVSRASVLATGFFGCDNLAAAANITIQAPSGLNV
jgi:hypothetical protein